MANDGKKFDLELGTKADTSGLEATERELRAVEAAADDAVEALNPMTDGSQLAGLKEQTEALHETADAARDAADAAREDAAALDDAAEAAEDAMEAQRKLDVEQAKANKSAREQAEQLRRVEENTRRLVAIGLASELNQIAQQFRGVSRETDLVLDGVSALSAGLASGNPYVALGAAALTAGKAILNARKEAAAYVEEGRKNAEASMAALQRAVEAQRIDEGKNFLARFLSDGLAGIDQAYQDLLRLKQLAEATRAADASDREARQQAALRSGADPRAVDRADVAGDFADELNSLRAEVQAAKDLATRLQAEADALRADFALKEADGKFDQAEVDAAKAAADEAQATADDASAKATNAAALVEQKLRMVLNEYDARVQEGVDGLQADAMVQVAAIVQAIESDGAKLSAAQQDALDRTKAALADGKLTAQEQQQFITDFQGNLSTIRVNTETQVGLMRSFIEITQGQQASLKQLAVDRDQLRREVEQLKIDLNRPR